MSKVITISIGNELLNGLTLDTNSHWLAQQLNLEGYQLIRKYTIPDVPKDLVNVLDQEIGEVDIIIMTGGLGPTEDDLTQSILANYFNSPIEKNEFWYEHLKKLYIERRGGYEEHNLYQAWMPTKAQLIVNSLGTAPGMYFIKERTLIFSLPGVPFEMKNMFQNEVLKEMKIKYPVQTSKVQKSILIAGIGESDLAEKLKAWEERLLDDINVAYLPGVGYLKLNLTVEGDSLSVAKLKLEKYYQAIAKIIEPYKINEKGALFVESIFELLKAHHKTIGFVESCTGGLFSSELTNLPGSSSVFKGSIIAYANELKEKVVGVDLTTLKIFGAVSQEVAIEMAKKGREQLDVDYCLSISGILGPDGGSKEKPIGTVYMAVATSNEILVRKFHLGYERLENKELALNYGWNFLQQIITQNSQSLNDSAIE